MRRVFPYLAYCYLSLVKFTTRLKIVGEENRASLRDSNRRFIYAFWHNQQMFFTSSHRKDNLSVLVSLSRDGELIAKLMSLSRIRASRGSSSRNASGALKEMMNLTKEGFDLGITPDGPKGPSEEAKVGAVFLAQKLQIPILPTSNALSNKIVIKKSWDRYQIPVPAGLAAIAYGPPVFVGPEDDLKLKARELTQALKAATNAAEENVQKRQGAFVRTSVLILENVLFVPALFLFLLKFLFSPRRQALLGIKEEILERLGFLSSGNKIALSKGKVFWIHAASIGEVSSIIPFLRLLKTESPDSKIILTVTNAQALKRARELQIADVVALSPLDCFFAVKNFLRAARPAALILVETELWPHLIELSSKKNIPIALIGGTLSSRSFRRYRLVSSLIKPFLRRLSLIAAQTETDAEYFKRLGSLKNKTIALGNLKYDAVPSSGNAEARKALEKLSWQKSKIFIAASVHPREEEIIAQAYAQAREIWPELKLIIAPRHIENAGGVRALLEKMDIPAISWSELGTAFLAKACRIISRNDVASRPVPNSPDALVLDALGVLSGFYDSALLTFVGGTLVNLGGHSLIEPALSRSPLAFGPSTFSNEELAELLIKNEAGFRVRDAADLSQVLERLAKDGEGASSSGLRAQNLARDLQGASLKTMAALKNEIPSLFL